VTKTSDLDKKYWLPFTFIVNVSTSVNILTANDNRREQAWCCWSQKKNKKSFVLTNLFSYSSREIVDAKIWTHQGSSIKVLLQQRDLPLKIKKQELSYRQQIARQLSTQYAEGIYRHKYYTVTLKSRLNVTQGHWTQNHWIDHKRLSSSRVIGRWIQLLWPWNVG